MKDTSHLSEVELRQLQLREIRAMLGLMPDAPHEKVIDRLIAIGVTDKRIDLGAVPERYQFLLTVMNRASGRPVAAQLPDVDGLCQLTEDKMTAVVTFDPDPAKNGVYRRTPSGWERIGIWTSASPGG